jgi:hypothetical protein
MQSQVSRGDDPAISHHSNAQASVVILKIDGTENDVSGIDDLIGLERLWNQPMQFLWWLDDNAPIAEGEYDLL